MFALMLGGAKKIVGNFRKVNALRKSASGLYIDLGAKILGSVERVTLSPGCVIEDGAVLDMRFGGSISLGRDVTIRSGAILAPYGGAITIGDHSGVNHFTILYGHGGLTIGNHVRFAAHCVVIPANHGHEDREAPIAQQPLTMQGITIGDDVWIGAHCTVLDGVRIGDGSIVAAGAVVTKDIESYCVAAGLPARKLRDR